MMYRNDVISPKSMMVGCALLLVAACSSSSGGGGGTGGQAGQSSGGTGGGAGATGSSNAGGQSGGTSNGGATSVGGTPGSGGQTTGAGGGQTGGARSGGTVGTGAGGSQAGGTTSVGAGGTGAGGSQGGGTTSVGAGGTGTGGKSGGSGGAGGTGTAGQTGSPGIDGGLTSACTGKAWPTADPTKPGSFQTTSEKNVGPAAGYTPDPVYGDQQQHFNIYRPTKLDDGYCHPILVWSNGHGDNPEQNGPCVIDKAADKWCGQYKPVLDHLASHGFVVIASLSTTTSRSDAKTGLLPSIMGLEWLLGQAEDPSSAYYHRLDTAHIGAFGHSEGGMATCMMASDPRFSAISTVSGTRAITTIHAPAVFFCGGKETNFDPPMCDSNLAVANTITTQPSGLINALDEDHGSWAYDGASGVANSGFAAWFRLHLMGDTAQRKRFYGDGCTFCTDSRVKVLFRNSLMSQ